MGSTTIDTIYHLGVGNGAEVDRLFSQYPLARFLGCEPWMPHWNAQVQRYPGELMPVAIGLEKGPVLTYATKVATPNGSITTLKVPDAVPRDTTIMWTLDYFDGYFGKPDNIWIWADIEGSELRALESGPLLMASGRVNRVTLETQGKSPAPGWPSRREVTAYMAELGYYIAEQNGSDITYQPTRKDT